MNETLDSGKIRKDALKELIKRIHNGENPEEVKRDFKEILKGVTPQEVAQTEEELIKEGLPREEIQNLCEVHLAVFKESLEKERGLAPKGHPIYTLTEEHKIILKFADEFNNVINKIKEKKDFNTALEEMNNITNIEGELKNSESHYLREENVLFPYLEKRGITQPPKIMWMEHNRIREIKKNIYSIIDVRESFSFKDFTKKISAEAKSLGDMLSSHFFKENNILFPTTMKVITDDEWKDIGRQFNEIGYCSFTPEDAKVGFLGMAEIEKIPEVKERISFETGTLSLEELESILNKLPFDVTFVDKDDTFRYFSGKEQKDMIFVRTKASIGRKVQQCHPQKSVHIVNQIIKDFKTGLKDVAKFWINLKSKLVYIRYFPVHNKKGEYLGCIEVTQDITDIKKIKGEKRLL